MNISSEAKPYACNMHIIWGQTNSARNLPINNELEVHVYDHYKRTLTNLPLLTLDTIY